VQIRENTYLPTYVKSAADDADGPSRFRREDQVESESASASAAGAGSAAR
jgi:hypothetical protein